MSEDKDKTIVGRQRLHASRAAPDLPSEGTKGPFGKGPFGKWPSGLKHKEAYPTPIFCTVPLPKVPLVPSNSRLGRGLDDQALGRKGARPRKNYYYYY